MNVLDERAGYIFMVDELNMDVAGSSEMLLPICRTARNHIADDLEVKAALFRNVRNLLPNYQIPVDLEMKSAGSCEVLPNYTVSGRRGPENGVSTFLRNVSNHLPNYTVSERRRPENGIRFLRNGSNSLPNCTASHPWRPEDRACRFFRNVDDCLPNSTSSHPREPQFKLVISVLLLFLKK
jgi:hypothetical protein